MFKSMLCAMVFAIVSLHSLVLHGHRDRCEAESHLHDIVHCEQLDIFVPADADSDPTPLACLLPELPRIDAPAEREDPAGRISDESDGFISREKPDSGGRGLRAPPAL